MGRFPRVHRATASQFSGFSCLRPRQLPDFPPFAYMHTRAPHLSSLRRMSRPHGYKRWM